MIKPELGRFFAFAKPKSVTRNSDDDATVAVINTDSVDRHGTIINPKGMDVSSYNENSVFLINHDHDRLAGKSQVKLKDNKWIATVRDSDWDDDDPEIAKYKNKVKKGIMNMTSVGIIPIEMGRKIIEKNSEEDEVIPVIEKSELLEWSFVSVGSNPEALIQQRNMATDFLSKLEELHKKLDKILAGEIRMSDSQVDALIDAVTTPVVTEKPPAQRKPSSSLSDRWTEDKLAQIVNKAVNLKLGKQ